MAALCCRVKVDGRAERRVRLSMADLASAEVGQRFIQVSDWNEDRPDLWEGLGRPPIWDKQSGCWHVLLPGFALLLTLNSGKPLETIEDVTISSAECMRLSHVRDVSPSGLILAKIVSRFSVCGLNDICSHRLSSSFLVSWCDLCNSWELMGPHLGSIA